MAGRTGACAQGGDLPTGADQSDLFRLRELGRQAIKGFTAPVEAFVAEGVAVSESRFEAARRRLTDLVGRAAESALLRDRLHRMTPHTPRRPVIEAAAAAREVGADLVVTIDGGSVTDGAKAVQLCLANDIRTAEALDQYRPVKGPDGLLGHRRATRSLSRRSRCRPPCRLASSARLPGSPTSDTVLPRSWRRRVPTAPISSPVS